MNKNDKIVVFGKSGMIGSSIIKELESHKYTNIIKPARRECNLLNERQVRNFFRENRPDYVFICAAKNGGERDYENFPVEFLVENIKIEMNVLSGCHEFRVQKALTLGSSALYRNDPTGKLSEKDFLTGVLNNISQPYMLAKLANIELAQSYRKEFGDHIVSALPCQVYGPNDNYTPSTSHIIPSLIRKIHEAKELDLPSVSCWGKKNCHKEFVYVDDFAKACILLMNKYESEEVINVGTGEDICIQELVGIVKDVVDYKGKIVWEDYCPEEDNLRKIMNVNKINKLGWYASTPIKEGIEKTYEWFKTYEFSQTDEK